MKLFVSALIASNSVEAGIPDDLAQCLEDSTGCIVTDFTATFDANGFGSFESHHPYANDQLYIYRVASSGTLEWEFEEFEIDMLDDGTCADEVWIFKGGRAPEGPYCGFDDAFYDTDSLNYDYYYDHLLGTMPEVIKGSHYSVDSEIVIGLKSKSLVNNWGFKVSYKEKDCAPGYILNPATGFCRLDFKPISPFPTNLVCPGPDCSGISGRMSGGAFSGGGLADSAGAWNFLATLHLSLDDWKCTGTILDAETILTNADCCLAGVQKVEIGNWNSNINEPGEFRVAVESTIIHPDFDPVDVAGNKANNLCILKTENLELSQPETCDNCWSSVCLPETSYGIGHACWTAGWGAVAVGGSPSAKLRESALNIFSRQYCMNKSKPSFQDTEMDTNEFCAGTVDADNDGLMDEGPSPCTHDGGSPLVCDVEGAPVMYGAFSRQIGCSKKGQPSVFTDIFANRIWIRSHMAEICPTQPPTEATFETAPDDHLPAGLSCDNEPSGRIISGLNTGDDLDRWSFLVNIARKNEPEKVTCGGTVVNGCHVLTSAHCCWNYRTGAKIEANAFQVGFGNYDVRADKITPGEFYSDIYDVQVHPNFDPETKAHDLCVLQFYPLAQQTADPSVVSSACLPSEHDVDMRMCWTAGWGANTVDEDPDKVNPLNTPREVPLNVFPHDYCTETTDSNVLKYDQFCAGVPDHDEDGQADGGDSPCDFDEGNPLICPVDGRPVLYGVTSQVSCGAENAATIFTKTVSSWNTPWIEETIGRECPVADGECLFPAYMKVPVTWLGARQTKIIYSTNDAIMAQISIPNFKFDFDLRETPYLAFTIFQRRFCGQGFFDAYYDGGITYKTVMDIEDHYDLQYSYMKIDDRYSSLTQQIRMHTVAEIDYPYSKKTGKFPKKDQFFLFMGGLSNVEWKGKDMRQCFEKIVVGAMEMPSRVGDATGDFDYTPCVGEEKIVGF